MGDRKHCFVNVCSLAVLSSSVGEGLWSGGRRYYLGPAEMASFSSRDLRGCTKHDIFWDVV